MYHIDLNITYLFIYRTNIDHKRATKLYDMPRLLHGFALVFARIYSFLLLFFFTSIKIHLDSP